MITQRQKDLLIVIRRHSVRNGLIPSYREMADEMGLKSVSGIQRLIKGLEERGFIRRISHRARAIEIIKIPGCLYG